MCNDGVVTEMYDVLTEQLGKNSAVVLTAENPDIVHIIGAWNTYAVDVAKKSARRCIPFVYTPLGSLAPWNKPALRQRKISADADVIVASGTMEQKLLKEQYNGTLRLIPNSVTTHATTAAEMAVAYLSVYKEATDGKDAALWLGVDGKMKLLKEDDAGIVSICRNLLYAQCLYNRHNIPETFLHDLSSLMTSGEYDEDHFADVLELLGLHDFTRRLEYVMKERSSLTEGFMPVPPNGDKEAVKMLDMVTDYEKQ